jgi:hypothetical protein
MNKLLFILMIALNLFASYNTDTVEISKTGWYSSNNGKYGLDSIKNTTIKSNWNIIEIVTLSIDCSRNNKLIPNLEYMININDSTDFNKLKWWEKIDGEIIVYLDNKEYSFKRVKEPFYQFHPFQTSDYTSFLEHLNSTKNVYAEILIFGDDGKRKIDISVSNLKYQLNDLKQNCI